MVADQLATGGRVRRGYLGVSIRSVEDVAVAYGLDPNLKGVLIESISDPNGPGATAGLRPGDVITKFEGKAVTKSSELQRMVGNAPIGSTITLDVVRGGKTIQLKAVTKELKDAPLPKPGADDAVPAPGATNGTSTAIPGLKTKNLSADVARALGIKTQKGVVVTQVDEGSPAEDADLQRGDVIEQVGQTSVGSVTDMNSQIAQILNRQTGTGKKVALYINRNGERRSVVITVN
jgi:serine protease Do